jgi:dipicolinate synthase subunit A
MIEKKIKENPMNNFLFLGGDMRSVYAAKKLGEHFDCFLYGFNKLDIKQLREITKFKSLVLPLPASRDEVNINAPFSKAQIPISIIPQAVEAGGTVYCGKAIPEIERICAENNLKLTDYFEREELIIKNAIPTSEGCIEIIFRERGSTVFGAEILLTGFGRVSKVLAKHLLALGAKVTVTARKYSDLAWAEIEGCKVLHLSRIDEALQNFDIIINSVPALIFNAESMKKCKPDSLKIDLASEPGFEDMTGVVHALSLPRNIIVDKHA